MRRKRTGGVEGGQKENKKCQGGGWAPGVAITHTHTFFLISSFKVPRF